ncbi:uncharacterized protein ACA1_170210 [Acanthamoeba castellanii str. Neff]|uniref:Uncharacterized protein n=1 Tax=Acanthamoeba castellanii (strain ATCC 30010 / Neff) TaxID=1257118 RepID=L8HHV1_ACACF|nr:uncharacterized protein ACA1_170210 [Acanthamoeba castellanii str. Neff]ELR24283.1 hypothetical protein ACA1_170210 [Acanthamoeba castellanii str. Neff]
MEALDEKKGEWWHLHKSKVLTGTFDDAAFQIQITLHEQQPLAPTTCTKASTAASPQAEVLESSEPLAVPLFDGLGYHCVPHCGVYAQDDYEPALPFAFISLPYELLQRTLDLATATTTTTNACQRASSSLYVMVHPIPRMKECQHFMCDSRREINVITHAWTLPDVHFTPELEVETDVDVGLFGASGVEETHMNMQDSKFNGLPFNRMERRAVIIHWQSFSPLNAQIRLSENRPWHSFFLVSRHWPTSRQCVSYHIVIESDEVYNRAHEAVAQMNTLGELLDFFRTFGHGGGGGEDLDQWDYDPFAALTRLVEHCLDQVHHPQPPSPSS